MSTLEGEVTWGRRYVDGKVTHMLRTGDDRTRSDGHEHSGEGSRGYTFRICTHMTINDFTKSGTNASNECILDDPNLTSSGGYSYCGHCNETHWIDGTIGGSGDSSQVPNVPSTFPTQSDTGTCSTTSMSHVNKLFGGSNTEEYYNDLYTQLRPNDTDFKTDGLTPEYVGAIVQTLFNTESFNGYKDAIDNENVVMTNMGGHSVVIVGYSNGGDTLEYMDPEVGTLKTAPASKFGSEYNYSISGNKY